MSRVSSKKYLAAARGQPCTFRIPNVCNGNPETTVAAHIRDGNAGRSIKASDVSIADACSDCHRVFDGQGGKPLEYEDWAFYAIRGLQETLENRIRRGICIVPQDPPKTHNPSKANKPKPKSQWPAGRKLQSKNTLRK